VTGAPGRAFADMPLVLKGATSFFAVFGAGSLLVALAPGVEHRVAGESLDRAAFFASGHGVVALAMGAWLAGAAAGLLRRARWGCWAAVGAWLPLLAAEAFVAETPRFALHVALALVWGGAAAAYLFRTPEAVAFLRGAGHGEAG